MELTFDAFNVYQRFLPADFFKKFSATVGLPADKTKSALMTAIPAVLSAVQQKAATPGGTQDIMTAIHNNGFDQTPVEGAQASVDTQLSKGQSVLSSILGGKMESLLGTVSSSAGVAKQILGAAATAVFGFLGAKMKGGQSVSTFSSLLAQGNSIPDLSGVRTNTLVTGASVNWKWIVAALLGVIAIIWLFSRTADTPVAVAPTAERATAPATTAATATDASVISGIVVFLRDSSQSTPRTFSLNELNFASGSSALSTQAQSTVQQLAQALQAHPNSRVRIQGNTDNMGNAQLNAKLSLDRANSIAGALTAAGIARDRIETAGMGAESPIADNSSEEGRRLNRRTDIVILTR
jgi:OmpA-OmpF porin, OOP family